METLTTEPAERIADLEAELGQCQTKIKELTTERDEANELVNKMREHVEDVNQTIEQWIEAFDMEQDENGLWSFTPAHTRLFDAHVALQDEHRKLIRQWNKFVGVFNAQVSPRERGRPLAASTAQQKDVLRRRKAKESLRAIAVTTSLSLQTVRTIIEKAERRGRSSKRTNELRRKEFARHRAAAYRVRKAARDRLPQAIMERQKEGEALIKAAKGFGRS